MTLIATWLLIIRKFVVHFFKFSLREKWVLGFTLLDKWIVKILLKIFPLRFIRDLWKGDYDEDRSSSATISFIILKTNKYSWLNKSEIVLHSWLLLMATPPNSYSFCDDIIASGKLCNYEYLLITVFVETKEM